MKIYIGADHQGFHLKAELVSLLQRLDYEVVDDGDKQLDPNDDFPQFAGKVANSLLAEGDDNARGILICGSGQGMCMAANRFKGIRASLAWDIQEAKDARNDDDSNILCLPARIITGNEAESIVKTWLDTPFAAAPRYKRRIMEMDELSQ